MNDIENFATPMRRLNPNLGWFFRDTTAQAQAESVRRFAESFLAYLGRADTASIVQSGESTPTVDAVIVFSSHNSVYIPPSFFADPNDPSTEFNGFIQTSAGGQFSNWSFERDKEVFATESAPSALGKDDLTHVIEPAFRSTDQALMAPRAIAFDGIPIVAYWHLFQVLAEPFWPNGLGEGSRVAVLDSGMDQNNPLLTSGSLGGASFVPGNPSYNDDFGHGTHVTGILAARPGASSDGKPLYWSIAPGSSHFDVKVLDNTGNGPWVQVVQGLDWARNTGVDVINMSLGSLDPPPSIVHDAIAAASQGAVIIASAGNNGPGVDTVNWPARYREVIGVGAVDRNRVIADFSSRGPTDPNAFVEDNVECVAPGVDIFSNRLGGGPQDLMTMSGTSMAAPMVSAICALLKQKDSSLIGTDGFRFRLRRSFIDLGIPGPDNWYGLGLVHFDPGS